MSLKILLIFGVIGVMAVVVALRSPSRWQLLVRRYASEGEPVLDELLQELQRRPSVTHPRFYDEAMQHLMPEHIDSAVRLTLLVLPQCSSDRRCQHWLQVLAQLVPRSPSLTTEFLERHSSESCSPGGG